MSNDKKLGLGKGLSTLLGSDGSEDNSSFAAEGDFSEHISVLGIMELFPSPFQPRQVFSTEAIEDLVDSIKEKGILQPLLVRQSKNNPSSYEIIAGERRWRAAKAAGLNEVPVIIKDFNDKETLEVALVENLQRQDLSPLEEAEGYRRLLEEFSHTQEELAKVIGKSRSHIANTVRLLGLPDKVKGYIEKGELSAGHARALINAKHPETLAEKIVSKGLNVRQTEQLAKEDKNLSKTTNKTASVKPEKNPDIQEIEEALSDALGMPVIITVKDDAGSINIRFKSLSELDDIVQTLSEFRKAS